MKLRSYQEMLSEYGITDLNPDDKPSHAEMLLKHPYSVILEGEYMELDNLGKWIISNISENEVKWLFYGKTGYNYGFAEYFFDKEIHALAVEKIVPLRLGGCSVKYHAAVGVFLPPTTRT